MDEQHRRLMVPADRYCGTAHQALLAALAEMRKTGEPRVWPTTTGFCGETDRALWVTGFVAARVVRVTEEEDEDDEDDEDKARSEKDKGDPNPKPKPKVIRLTLRPAMVCTPMAVTRHGAPANPYVCTVRLLVAE